MKKKVLAILLMATMLVTFMPSMAFADRDDDWKTYSISYVTNGGTINGAKATSYVYGRGATLPTNVTKAGSDFAGWYSNQNLTGDRIYSIGKKEYGNKTFYAKWTVQTYRVQWHTNCSAFLTTTVKNKIGTTLVNAINAIDNHIDNVAPGSAIPAYPMAAANMAELSKYYTVKYHTGHGTTDIYADNYKVNSNIDVHVSYEPVNYSLTYNLNGGTGTTPTDTNKMYKDIVALKAATGITKANCTFNGWKVTDANGNVIPQNNNKFYMPASNVTITAQWKENGKFTVTYKDGLGGSVFADQTDSVYVGSNTPGFRGTANRTGYTHTGWTPAVAPKVFMDAVYTAVWTANTYKVTFDSNGGSKNPAAALVKYDAKYGTVAQADPGRKIGYAFAGWALENGQVIGTESICKIAGDHKLVAQWTDKTFNVKFDPNNGDKVTEKVVAEGSLLDKPKTPTKKNFKLKGWKDQNGNMWDFGTSQVMGDTVLTAVWEPAVYEYLMIQAADSGKNVKTYWNELSNAKYYVLYGNQCGSKAKKLAKTTKTSYTVKKIAGKKVKAHKTYKFYVVAYDKNGKKIDQSLIIHFIKDKTKNKMSNVVSVEPTVKEATIKVGETVQLGATYKTYKNMKHLDKSHGAQFRFKSNTPGVAKVNSSGLVKGLNEGTTTVFVQDAGGVYVSVPVTVTK